jgi:hypothetical protein
VRAVAAWLDRLWFPASSPGRLAVLRILVGGFALWHLWARQRAFGVIARTASEGRVVDLARYAKAAKGRNTLQ